MRVAHRPGIYPCPPLIALAASGEVLGEDLSPAAVIGIGTISAGILVLAFDSSAPSLSGIILAVANACVIAAYTFVDGAGARSSGNPFSYTYGCRSFPL